MSQPLTDAINALTTYANSVTGASDTTLSDAVDTLAAGYGGGGGSSPIQLIDTITVPADTRTFDLDLSGYTSYDMFLVVTDVTLSAVDWLYYVPNGTSATGGTYSSKLSNLQGVVFAQLNPMGNTASMPSYAVTDAGTRKLVTAIGAANNLYFWVYTATVKIKAGSKFRIYGGNYSDM